MPKMRLVQEAQSSKVTVRWPLRFKVEQKAACLYQCDECKRIVSSDSNELENWCCTPCRECKKARYNSGHHPFPMIWYMSAMISWRPDNDVHFYEPERRSIQRRSKH